MLQHLILVLIMSLIFFCSCATGPDESGSKIVRVNPRSSQSEIRATLLNYTPIGSVADDVLRFTRARLTHVHKSSDYYDKPNGRIVVLLGHYGLGRETFVTWKFDEHDKLVDLFVEKYRDFL